MLGYKTSEYTIDNFSRYGSGSREFVNRTLQLYELPDFAQTDDLVGFACLKQYEYEGYHEDYQFRDPLHCKKFWSDSYYALGRDSFEDVMSCAESYSRLNKDYHVYPLKMDELESSLSAGKLIDEVTGFLRYYEEDTPDGTKKHVLEDNQNEEAFESVRDNFDVRMKSVLVERFPLKLFLAPFLRSNSVSVEDNEKKDDGLFL